MLSRSGDGWDVAVVDEKSGGLREIASHHVPKRAELRSGLDGGGHVSQPSFTLGRPDAERHVAHTQTRVSALFLVALGTAEALDQEPDQVQLGVCQVRRVQRAQDGVSLDPTVESFNKSIKRPVVADGGVNLDGRIVHGQFGATLLSFVSQRSIPAPFKYNRRFRYTNSVRQV